MKTHPGDKTKTEPDNSGGVHPRIEEAVVGKRHVWVERDATDSIVAVSESRQVLEDTDDDYAVIVRRRSAHEHLVHADHIKITGSTQRD